MKVGKVIYNTSENKYLAWKPDRKLGKMVVIGLHCAKLDYFKWSHRKYFTAATFTDLCNCFSVGKVEMSSLVTENATYTPLEYTSIGTSWTCSEAVCCQEHLGYQFCSFLSFWAFLPFTHLGICGPASLLGYPAMNSHMSLQVDPSSIKSKNGDLLEQEFKLDLPLCYV